MRTEIQTSPKRRNTTTWRRCGATCAATGAASTNSSRAAAPRCTGQHIATAPGRSSPFSWRRARPWTSCPAPARELRGGAVEPPSVVPPTAAAEVTLRCTTQQCTASRRTPSCCWSRRPRWTSRTSTAGGLSRCHNCCENLRKTR